MSKTLVEKFVEDPQRMREFQQERAIVEVTDLLESTLEEMGITRSQFAELLGKSKGWITQLLDFEGNKTIRTVADAFAVLGLEYRSFCQPIRVSNKTTHSTSKNSPARRPAAANLHPNILSIADWSSAKTMSAQEAIQESA